MENLDVDKWLKDQGYPIVFPCTRDNCAKIIRDYLRALNKQKLQQHGVVRPAVESGSEGEPLPAEGHGEANKCADCEHPATDLDDRGIYCAVCNKVLHPRG